MSRNVVLNDAELTRIIQQQPEQAESWLDGVAQQITNEIVQSFGTSPPGRSYGNHVASSPGYPPNVDTGALSGSIRWEPAGVLTRRISDGVTYGYYLEMGTESIEARPFVRPVFNRWNEAIAEDARRHLLR